MLQIDMRLDNITEIYGEFDYIGEGKSTIMKCERIEDGKTMVAKVTKPEQPHDRQHAITEAAILKHCAPC